MAKKRGRPSKAALGHVDPVVEVKREEVVQPEIPFEKVTLGEPDLPPTILSGNVVDIEDKEELVVESVSVVEEPPAPPEQPIDSEEVVEDVVEELPEFKTVDQLTAAEMKFYQRTGQLPRN